MKIRTPKLKQSGFTLIEIMIVVAIIGVLAAMAIPNLMKARKDAARAACVQNLKAIEGAKNIWALEMKKLDTETPTAADLYGPGKQIRDEPKCPAGGVYDVRPVAEKPTCSVPEHTY